MIDKRKIKTWSLIGARATVGMYALDLVNKDPNLLILFGRFYHRQYQLK